MFLGLAERQRRATRRVIQLFTRPINHTLRPREHQSVTALKAAPQQVEKTTLEKTKLNKCGGVANTLKANSCRGVLCK